MGGRRSFVEAASGRFSRAVRFHKSAFFNLPSAIFSVAEAADLFSRQEHAHRRACVPPALSGIVRAVHQVYTKETDIGVFHLSGPRNETATRAAWSSFAACIVADRLRGVLICDATTSTLTVTQHYYLAQVLARKQQALCVPVAVFTPPGHPDNDNTFFVNCLFNRGTVVIRYFPSEDAARLWLAARIASHRPPATSVGPEPAEGELS